MRVRSIAGERSARTAARAMLVLGLAVSISGCGAVGAVSGPAVFANHCASCHSLSGASAPQQQGGDLKKLRLSQLELLQYTEEMPAVHGRLSPRELRAVVAYVQSVERR